jgi:hypothetical protein
MALGYDDETDLIEAPRMSPSPVEKREREAAHRTTVILDMSFLRREGKAFREIGFLLLIASLIPFASGTGLFFAQEWGAGICAFLLGAAFLLPVPGVFRRKSWAEWSAFFLCGATTLVSILATVEGTFERNLLPMTERLGMPIPLGFFLLPVFLLLVFFVYVRISLALWSAKPKRKKVRSTR